jgi:[histone H3]-lysine4 N-trimethyltransferase SETD1
MQLIDDKSYIRASKSRASPPRRKPLPKKSLEDESAEIILAELKEVFIKDVRSRIVNPMILDFLDPSHYKDIHPKTESETPKTVRPDVKISPVKPETVPPEGSPITSRIPSLPRFRKKAVEPLKRGTSVGDRKPTKADVRPMHHQFNDYSDSEDEDERPQREATVISDDEDESSRPSRETTTVSTPEPSRVKGKTLVKIRDTVKEDIESEEELLKDVLATTTDGIQTKRKRVVDFTSSEDEDEPSPSKKVCVESEAPQISDAMEIDEPKLSKAAIQKMAKAKAAALRRAKKAEVIVKEIEDSIAIENVPVKEVKAQVPTKPKIQEVDLTEIEDDENTLLDLDGVQTVVRDREDFRYLLEALVDVIPESIQDIWTWSWKQKKLKALNFDGARGTYIQFFLSDSRSYEET